MFRHTLVTGHLQVADMKVVVPEFYEEYPRIYACLCGYSRVYVGLNEIIGSDSG